MAASQPFKEGSPIARLFFPFHPKGSETYTAEPFAEVWAPPTEDPRGTDWAGTLYRRSAEARVLGECTRLPVEKPSGRGWKAP